MLDGVGIRASGLGFWDECQACLPWTSSGLERGGFLIWPGGSHHRPQGPKPTDLKEFKIQAASLHASIQEDLYRPWPGTRKPFGNPIS